MYDAHEQIKLSLEDIAKEKDKMREKKKFAINITSREIYDVGNSREITLLGHKLSVTDLEESK